MSSNNGSIYGCQWLATIVLLVVHSPMSNAFAPSSNCQSLRALPKGMNQHFMSSGDGSEDAWVKGERTDTTASHAISTMKMEIYLTVHTCTSCHLDLGTS